MSDNQPLVDGKKVGDHSPTQTVNNFLDKPGNRNIILGVVLGLAMIEGFMLWNAYREKQVSEDLHGFDAREAQVRLEVDEQLLNILNCRRDK